MRILFIAVGLTLITSYTVFADRPFPPITSEAVNTICSTCHMPYQPQMLSRKSWQTLIDGLGHHFGQGASLTDPVRQEVLSYLLAHAADVDRSKNARKFLRGVDPNNPPLRITETPQFIHEHHELSADVWNHPRVGSKANCVACHPGASHGNYDDD